MSNSILFISSRVQQFLFSSCIMVVTFTIQAQEVPINGTITKIDTNNIVLIENSSGDKIYVKIEASPIELPSELLNTKVSGSCHLRGDLCITKNIQVDSQVEEQ